MRSDMVDWNHALRVNAASCVLAKQVYQATASVYRPDALPFEDLAPRIKDRYIQQAKSLIQFGASGSLPRISHRELSSAPAATSDLISS